jgi:integrase/recombinase XerD
MARPKHSTKEKKAIGVDEYNLLMQHTTNKKVKLAFLLLFYTGCRNSEIINFTHKDLEYIFTHKEYSLDNNNKTRSTRLLHFSSKAIEEIKAIDTDTSKEYLFFKNGSNNSMSTSSFNQLLNKHIKAILGDMYSSHSFRKGIITDIVNTTGNIKLAQKIAGHSSSTTTNMYVQVTNDDVRNSLSLIR